jgi:hypothetical protein
MGILMDLVHGLIAIIGLIIGGIIGRAIALGIIVTVILVIIGLVLAGWGLKKRGFVGAFVTGFGLGLASPITGLLDGGSRIFINQGLHAG